MAAHEYSYGKETRRDEASNGIATTYHVELTKKATMRRWRELALAAITWSMDDPPKRCERLTVCDRGPVCAEFWRAAYGIPECTANNMLAAARSNSLRVDTDEGMIQVKYYPAQLACDRAHAQHETRHARSECSSVAVCSLRIAAQNRVRRKQG